MVSDGVCYLFYRPMDEKIKTCTLRFPAKENPNMENALFDWSIASQYDVKAKYRLISRKFLGMKFFSSELSLNQKQRRTGNFLPWGGGKPFAKKTSQVAQIFTKESKRNEGHIATT